MRRIVSPLAVAILALAAGCADSTSPAATARTALSPSALIGNPPPPPSDTSGTYHTTSGAFTFGAVYFLNPTEKNGFIHFNTGQPAGVTVSPNASIDYHLGTITGTGTITGVVDGGTISIDLTRVASKGSFNGSCASTCAVVTAPGTFIDKQGDSTSTDGVFTIGTTDQTPTSGD